MAFVVTVFLLFDNTENDVDESCACSVPNNFKLCNIFRYFLDTRSRQWISNITGMHKNSAVMCFSEISIRNAKLGQFQGMFTKTSLTPEPHRNGTILLVYGVADCFSYPSYRCENANE